MRCPKYSSVNGLTGAAGGRGGSAANNMQAVRSRKHPAAVRRGRDRMSHMAGMLAKAQLLRNARRAQPNREAKCYPSEALYGATSAIVLQGYRLP